MGKNTIIRKCLWNLAWLCGIVLLWAGTPGLAQSSKVARDSLQVTPDPAHKEWTADQAAEQKKKFRIGVGSGLVVLLAVVVLMVRASRKRSADEARLAEETRMAEEELAAHEIRRAEETRRLAEEKKKTEAQPLAWLEMCDARQTRHPVRIPSLKIGRGRHNDFVLRDDSISGNHCVLNRTRENEWCITDLSSGNGVILNGERVTQAAPRHGDLIELGDLKMRFLLRP